MTNARIAPGLAALVGLPLAATGRAADMQWFAFGALRTVFTRMGREKQVGEYALHVQCPWRVVHDDRLVIGSQDLLQRADQCEALMTTLLARPLTVQRVRAGTAGQFSLELDHGHTLEVFPDVVTVGEHWRLFRPSTDEPHLVFTPSGIE